MRAIRPSRGPPSRSVTRCRSQSVTTGPAARDRQMCRWLQAGPDIGRHRLRRGEFCATQLEPVNAQIDTWKRWRSGHDGNPEWRDRQPDCSTGRRRGAGRFNGPDDAHRSSLFASRQPKLHTKTTRPYPGPGRPTGSGQDFQRSGSGMTSVPRLGVTGRKPLARSRSD